LCRVRANAQGSMSAATTFVAPARRRVGHDAAPRPHVEHTRPATSLRDLGSSGERLPGRPGEGPVGLASRAPRAPRRWRRATGHPIPPRSEEIPHQVVLRPVWRTTKAAGRRAGNQHLGGAGLAYEPVDCRGPAPKPRQLT
jgi:hypothetical protein